MTDVNIASLPQLKANSIHLWWACTQQVKPTTLQWQVLDSEEQNRAQRFKRDRDRDQYVLTRSLLRQLLSSYIQIPAADIQFCYGSKGKPALAVDLVDETVEFNVSHSNHFVLWGFSNQALGVDVEYIKPEFQADRIAKRFFTHSEYRAFQSQPIETQQTFFFRLWTRKESCIKATGDSLFEKIGQLEVSSGNQPTLQWIPLSCQSLYVQDLQLHPDYCAAIASVTEGLELSCFEVDFSKGLTRPG